MQREGKRKRVLVLSSSKEFRLFSARALKLGGYSVQVAKDAKDAISIVREAEHYGEAFDLIVAEMEEVGIKFYDNLSKLYAENVYIPALPMHNLEVESFNKENGVLSGVKDGFMGNNFIGQIRTVTG